LTDTGWRASAGPAVERTALMKKLKAQCGAGGKVAGDVVEIQGDHAAKIVQLLVQAGYTNTKKSGGK
jgi:translation initiation factor 1